MNRMTSRTIAGVAASILAGYGLGSGWIRFGPPAREPAAGPSAAAEPRSLAPSARSEPPLDREVVPARGIALPLTIAAIAQPRDPAIRDIKLRGVPFPATMGLTDNGPTAPLEITIDNFIPGTEVSVTRRQGGPQANPPVPSPPQPLPQAGGNATFTTTLASAGVYDVKLWSGDNTPIRDGEKTITIQTPTTHAPKIRDVVQGDPNGPRYITAGSAASVPLMRRAFQIEVADEGSARPLAVLDDQKNLIKRFDPGQSVITIDATNCVGDQCQLKDGPNRLAVVDGWALDATENASHIDVIVPSATGKGPAQPTIKRYADGGFAKLQDLATDKTIDVFGTYLKLSGEHAPSQKEEDLTFIAFVGRPDGKTFEGPVEVAPISRKIEQSLDWTAELKVPPLALDGKLNHIFAQASSQGLTALSSCVAYRTVDRAFVTTDPGPAINKIDLPTDHPAAAAVMKRDGDYHTNSKKLVFSGDGAKPGTRVLVFLDEGNPPIATSDVVPSNGTWSAANTAEIAEGDNHRVQAAMAQGDQQSQRSAAITLNVNTQNPEVGDISPANFGTAPGVQTLTIRFKGKTLDDQAQDGKSLRAGNKANYVLLPSGGTGRFDNDLPKITAANEAIFKDAQYDQATNTVTLRFVGLPADIYRLQIATAGVSPGTGLRDVYGNSLLGDKNHPNAYFTRDLKKPETDVTGAIPKPEKAPFVEYHEFETLQDSPAGFNPGGKVETRVSRLYYFRDARRVAEIINRDLKSYNQAAVDTRRRLAEKARTDADALTDKRRLQEVKAVRAAQASRDAQRQFEQAQAKVAANQTTRAQAAQKLATLQDQLETLKAALPQAGTSPAAPNASTQAEITAGIQDVQQQMKATQQDMDQAGASQDSLQAAVQTARSGLQSARAAEAQASDEALQDQQQEDRAKENQFRLEVAAAHEDPNSYAPGDPKSFDPVRQVSVSVIGEGVLQFRGPIRGINTIRKMVHDIDAPAGQVRIALHTVQINGEHEPRMEVVASRIQAYIDHARFLTAQSAQMLRNAIVKVASEKAELACAEFPVDANMTPEQYAESQRLRDKKYQEEFFGKDFINELRDLDAEFLHTGNKLLSLHSMDTTSLASALFLLALAKNDTRLEILAEFQAKLEAELPMAEANYELASGRTAKEHQHHQVEPLAQNAKFQSFIGFFNAEIAGADTLNPLQHEFIRLAQILKSHLVTEMEYNQRVKERGLIEDKLGNYAEERKKQKQLEDDAKEKLRQNLWELSDQRVKIIASMRNVSNFIGNDTEAVGALERELQTTQVSINDLSNYRWTKPFPDLLRDQNDLLRGRNDLIPRGVQPLTLDGVIDVIRPQVRKEYGDEEAAAVLSRVKEDLRSGMPVVAKLDVIDPVDARFQAFNLRRVETISRASSKGLTSPDPLEPVSPIQRRVYFQYRTDPNNNIYKMFSINYNPDPRGVVGAAPADPTGRGPQGSGEDDLRQLIADFHRWFEQATHIREIVSQFTLPTEHQRLAEEASKLLDQLLAPQGAAALPRLTGEEIFKYARMIIFYNVAIEYIKDQIGKLGIEASAITARLSSGGQVEGALDDASRRWARLKETIQSTFRSTIFKSTILKDYKEKADQAIAAVDQSFQKLSDANVAYENARRFAQESRVSLDAKKLLDMLIDEIEDKYVELLEGTRSHTANIDGYVKAIATALDDDFNTQFYYPAFSQVRRASSFWDVQFGQVETTNILTNNRMFAKVEPQATMEFDLPKRDILINEAMNGAKAVMDSYGALVADPSFLALTKMQSGQPTSSPAPGFGGGANTVRNVLPGLPRSNDEQLLSQAPAGNRQFGAPLEALIPDPAIYKFETGTGFQIRPVIQPDGQSVTFHLEYMYTTNVREPVRADEKHLGRVKRHFIDTEVQLGNYELREISRYTVALKASRTSRGVPLFEDIPGLGILFRPLPSASSSLQQNVILGQSTIFPTLFDLMGLRIAPAVSDLDTLRLRNQEFIVRGRARDVSNRVFDYSTSSVDSFLRIPPAERRSDLYRTQESIPDVHPNGYRGPGLNFRDSQLQEGYDPTLANPPSRYVPSNSRDEKLPSIPGTPSSSNDRPARRGLDPQTARSAVAVPRSSLRSQPAAPISLPPLLMVRPAPAASAAGNRSASIPPPRVFQPGGPRARGPAAPSAMRSRAKPLPTRRSAAPANGRPAEAAPAGRPNGTSPRRGYLSRLLGTDRPK